MAPAGPVTTAEFQAVDDESDPACAHFEPTSREKLQALESDLRAALHTVRQLLEREPEAPEGGFELVGAEGGVR